MVNVINKKCEFPTCKIAAVYGLPYTKVSGYLMGNHSALLIILYFYYELCCCCCAFGDIDSADFLSPTCASTLQERRFCAEHKPAGMTNVTKKTCEFPSCKTVACFGLDADKASTVTDTQPAHDLCGSPVRAVIIAVFAHMLMQVALRCAAHMDRETMVNVVSPRCIAEGCNLFANYGLKGSKVSELQTANFECA
jgi:EsV-1-7 cysteine-rich motif